MTTTDGPIFLRFIILILLLLSRTFLPIAVVPVLPSAAQCNSTVDPSLGSPIIVVAVLSNKYVRVLDEKHKNVSPLDRKTNESDKEAVKKQSQNAEKPIRSDKTVPKKRDAVKPQLDVPSTKPRKTTPKSIKRNHVTGILLNQLDPIWILIDFVSSARHYTTSIE